MERVGARGDQEEDRVLARHCYPLLPRTSGTFMHASLMPWSILPMDAAGAHGTARTNPPARGPGFDRPSSSAP
jgi:hypothetical protein